MTDGHGCVETEEQTDRRSWLDYSASDPDQDYIYFMGSETLPFAIYFMGSETIPFTCYTILYGIGNASF